MEKGLTCCRPRSQTVSLDPPIQDAEIALQEPAHVKSRRIVAQSLGGGGETPDERSAADRQRRVQGLGGEGAGDREGDAEDIRRLSASEA